MLVGRTDVIIAKLSYGLIYEVPYAGAAHNQMAGCNALCLAFNTQ